MGKKMVFVACGAVAVLGGGVAVLLVPKKTIREKWGNLLRRLISWEEELPPFQMWLLINRLDDISNGAPAEQAVVVIKNQTLQKLNNCKWVSSLQQQSYIIETCPHFFQVKPSMQAHHFTTVCDDSFIYLIGGQYLSASKENAYCIDATKVVSGRATEEEQNSYKLSPMLVRHRIVRAAALTNENRIYAFGRLQYLYDESEPESEPDESDESSFGEIYDIKDNCWMSFNKVPFKDARRCTILGCVVWDSMIVLFLHKEEKKKEVGADGKLYKQLTRVSFYDLKEGWISTNEIEDNDAEICTGCILVLVGDDVFIVQSSSLYRYNLRHKRITGRIVGLQQMEELTGVLDDVVYLSSSDEKKFHMFCIFWVGFVFPARYLHFAFMKVGDDGENKLTVRFSSSVVSIPFKTDDYLIKCTRVIREASKDKRMR